MTPQLGAYIALAEDILAAADAFATRAHDAVVDSRRALRFRDRLIVGLALKIISSFRALVEDARAGRPEAMHHLKTMAEAWIYMRAAIGDPTDRKSELILADALDDKARTLRQSGPHVDASAIGEVERLRDALRRDGRRLPKIGTLAGQSNVGTWYWRVYRLACEPAHLGDLVEFMPLPAQGLRPGVGVAVYRAVVGIHHGIGVALAMIDTVNDNEMGLALTTEEFRRRFDALVRSDQ